MATPPPNENVDLGASVFAACVAPVVDRGENENPAPAGLAVFVFDPLEPNEKDGTLAVALAPDVDGGAVEAGLPKLKLGSEVVVDGALEPFVEGLKGLALALRLFVVEGADEVVGADVEGADEGLTPSRCFLYCCPNDSMRPVRSANGSASS